MVGLKDAFHDLFHDFCYNHCVQADKTYPLWHKMQPCLNCPVASFVEYLENYYESGGDENGETTPSA